MKSALLSAVNPRLDENLTASLERAGYAVERAATPQEAIAVLKDGPRDVLISESRRDSFAFLMQAAFRLHPQMPVHFIDGRSVFCFYPFTGQPPELIDAITGADVRIAAEMLRQPHASDAVHAPAPFLI